MVEVLVVYDPGSASDEDFMGNTDINKDAPILTLTYTEQHICISGKKASGHTHTHTHTHTHLPFIYQYM